MAHADHSAHPIETLRATVAALEVCIRRCRTRQTKTAVHWLRTSTRRMEAQLALLSMLPRLPSHERQKQDALHLLKQLRHAAGQVRDKDVQRDLILTATKADRAAPDPTLRKEARHLRRELKRKRDEAASHLRQLLQKQHTRLPRIFKELLDALAPSSSITITDAELSGLVLDWYHAEPHNPAAAAHDTAALHAIRKRAKLARYLAESAPESATASRRLAARFEKLQQAGGEWHDWLILTESAADEFGASAKFPRRFAARANRALHAFQRRLQNFSAA